MDWPSVSHPAAVPTELFTQDIRTVMSENIKTRIEKEIEDARAACDVAGSSSQECAAAWDAVEELQAEASHQREKGTDKTSLEVYCDTNPEADECRVYDT